MTALWLLSGCGNPQIQVTDATQGTTHITENANAAVVLLAEEDARLKEELQKDIDAICQRDPAVKSRVEAALLYSGLHAILAYRISNKFYKISII